MASLLQPPLSPGRFGALLVACTLATGLVLVAVLNLVIDPYGEYRLLSDVHYRTDLTSAVPLAEQLREGPHALVFGTSTSAPIDARAVGEPVLNFSMSLYGAPERVLHFLESLDGEQVRHVTRVFYAVEHVSLPDHPLRQVGIDYGSRAAFLRATLTNIQRPKILAAADRVLRVVSGRTDSELTAKGVYRHLAPRPYTPVRYAEPIRFSHGARQVAYLRGVADFCRERGIELVVFRTVVTRTFLESTDLSSLKRHFARILEAVPRFYSLTWIDGVSEDESQFRDPIHPGYDAMLREMALLTSPERDRYAVTRATLDAHMRMLRAKIRESGARR